MKRNFLEECLDVGVDMNFLPTMKELYQQQKTLSCYGRGQRLHDLRVPDMPSFFLANDKGSNKKTREARMKAGRGRGKTRRANIQEEHDCKDYSLAPSGLAEYNTNLMMETCSIKSASSISRDSDHSIGNGNVNLSQKASNNITLSSSQQKLCTLSSPSQSQPIMSIDSGSASNHVDDDDFPIAYLEGWRVQPPNVCQFNGIPLNFDLKIVKEIISYYGSLVDLEEKENDGSISLRVKFLNPEICADIATNMDNSDFTGTGSIIRCKHLDS